MKTCYLRNRRDIQSLLDRSTIRKKKTGNLYNRIYIFFSLISEIPYRSAGLRYIVGCSETGRVLQQLFATGTRLQLRCAQYSVPVAISRFLFRRRIVVSQLQTITTQSVHQTTTESGLFHSGAGFPNTETELSVCRRWLQHAETVQYSGSV